MDKRIREMIKSLEAAMKPSKYMNARAARIKDYLEERERKERIDQLNQPKRGIGHLHKGRYVK